MKKNEESIWENKNKEFVSKWQDYIITNFKIKDTKIINTLSLYLEKTTFNLNNLANYRISKTEQEKFLNAKLNLIKKHLKEKFAYRDDIVAECFNFLTGEKELKLKSGRFVNYKNPNFSLPDKYYDIFYSFINTIYEEPIYTDTYGWDSTNSLCKAIEEKLKPLFRKLKIENII